MGESALARTHVVAGIVCCLFAVVLFGAVGQVGAAAGDAGQPDADVRVISLGDRVSGAVDTGDPATYVAPVPRDDRIGTWYYESLRFEGAAGQLVHANLSAPGTDTVLVLIDPDGEVATVNADGGRGENSRLLYRLQQNGTYTVRVTSRQRMTTFEYSLSLSRASDFERNPGVMRVGDTVVGGVDESDAAIERFGGHYDNLTLDVERNRTISVRMASPVRSAVRIYGPDRELIETGAGTVPGESVEFVTGLPHGGEYTVVVSSTGGADPFPYRVSVTDPTPPPVTLDRDRRYVSKEYAEFDVRRTTLNTTVRYAGTPVLVTATVENTGTASGQFAGYLLADSEEVAVERRSVDVGRTETVRFRGRIDEPGTYAVFLNSVYVGDVDVRPRPNTSVSVSTANSTTLGVVSHAKPGRPVDVSLSAGESPDVDFDRLRLRFGTETRRLTVNAREEYGPGVGDAVEARGPLPAGARPIGVLSVETETSVPADGVTNATLEFGVAAASLDGGPSTVRLYRHDGSGNWSTIDTTVTDATGPTYRFEATVDETSTFALARLGPEFEISDVAANTRTPLSGDPVTVTGAVTNRGYRTGSVEIPLRIDGRRVATRTVSLAPNATATVRFERAFDDAGTHSIALGNGTGAIQVDVRPARTGTETPTPVTTAAPARDPTDRPTTVTTTTGAGPGFTGIVAVVAIALGALLAVRIER